MHSGRGRRGPVAGQTAGGEGGPSRAARSWGFAPIRASRSSSTIDRIWRWMSGPTAFTWARTTRRPRLARRILGPRALVGLSTHGAEDLRRCPERTGRLPVGGPGSTDPTKPGRPGTGLDYLRLAVSSSPVPVFVTGGVNPGTVAALAAAGARHFVVVRWLTEAADP